MSDPAPIRGAVLSDDGVYRYALTRRWATGPGVLWIMLNPSTADGKTDDATIRRVVRFSKDWGYAGCDVVNLFALRATDPAELKRHPEPIGPKNDHSIWVAASLAGLVVAAWGVHGIGKRAEAVETLIKRAGVDALWTIGQTKAGAPRHPLRVPASATPALFRRFTDTPMLRLIQGGASG